MKSRLLLRIVLFFIVLFIAPTLINAQALTGDKIIGPGGDYTSLADAITALNTNGVSGTLTLLVDADLTESGSSEISTVTLTGINFLVIKPNVGKTPTITFTAVATSGTSGNSCLAISGTVTNVGNITIDGSNTASGTTRDMTFALNDGTNGRYVIRMTGETDNVTIKNLKFVAAAIKPTTASSSRTYGVQSFASAAGAADNFTITNCEIGSATAAFYYSIYKPDGGTTPYGSNLLISNNDLFAQHKGLSVWGSDGTSNINDNNITVIGHPDGSYVQNSVNGIYCESWLGTVNIFNNKIVSLNVKALNQTALKALYGIIVYNAGSPAGQTANVYNNFISNFAYEGDATTELSEVIGIAVDAADLTVNVYYNTIYMSNISTHPVYGIRVYDDAGQLANIMNNIVVNTVDQTNAYATYVDPIVNNCLQMSDYNDLYVSGANANVGYYNGADYKALTDWGTATSKDGNSISINPADPFGAAGQLTSLTDLHWVSKPVTAFAGTPIVGFTTDIDGDTRSATSPYMGADEGDALTGVTQEDNNLPVDFSLEQNYPNPFNPSTVIRFSLKTEATTTLKIYDAVGKEIATLVNENLGAGSYTVNFSGTQLASGVYFYRINAGSFSETKQMVLIK